MIKKILLFLTIYLSTLALSSCCTTRHIIGTVYDKETKKPLDSVLVTPNLIEKKVFTNEKGEFELYTVSCSHRQRIVFIKNGYKEQKVKIKRDRTKNIYLIRVK